MTDMEFYLQLIAGALVAHVVIELVKFAWAVYIDQLAAARDTQVAQQLIAQQQQMLDDYAEGEALANQRTRAILLASGCTPELADELLQKDEAQILSLIKDAE